MLHPINERAGVVSVRVVEAKDPGNTLDEYDSPVAPRAGEILAWSVDGQLRPVHRVLEVRHWRAAMEEGTRFVGLLVLVEEIPWERRWETV